MLSNKMNKYRFGVEQAPRPEPFQRYENCQVFLGDISSVLAKLEPVHDVKEASKTLREDRSIFPVRRKGGLQEVSTWVRDTIIADHENAIRELSSQSTVTVELRHYHAIESGLEITTNVQTGEDGTGSILWLQIIVRLTDKEYIWWSHD